MVAKRKSGRPVKIPGEKSTKEKIFEAAIDLFAERGYDGVSIRDIAAAVGVKESAIYRHYGSKDEILDRIFKYPTARIGVVGPRGVTDEELILSMGVEGYMAISGNIFISWMEDPCMEKIFRILFTELYRNQQVKNYFLELVNNACSFWESNFTTMMKQKLIKPCDPKIMAEEFLSFFMSAYLDYFLIRYGNTSGSFQHEYGARIDQHVTFIVNSIKP
jgi:AcrR family transcriptional regulator